MLGISSAPEVYQHVIKQALTDCKGVANISDDIIVHGKQTTEKHEKLKEKKPTPNAENASFT